ncbi:3313_t:CDS:1 [Scutellospora calospora]|uniref:3313_t:CDS:1 n=1 Tax=Scutellospora calospora TaxID=85575 RepID=A0ACA9K9G8_9GLOM|nr:3313_t:CDS:1 [Scutellospora calospora]
MKKKYIYKYDIIFKPDNPKNKSYYLRIEFMQDKRKHMIEKYHRKKENLERLLEKYKLEFKEYNDRIDENKKKRKEIEKILFDENNSFIVDYELLKKLRIWMKEGKTKIYLF